MLTKESNEFIKEFKPKMKTKDLLKDTYLKRLFHKLEANTFDYETPNIQNKRGHFPNNNFMVPSFKAKAKEYTNVSCVTWQIMSKHTIDCSLNIYTKNKKLTDSKLNLLIYAISFILSLSNRDRKITIHLVLLPDKRKYTGKFTEREINGGYCSYNEKEATVNVWRAEECIKVLFHECIHGLSFSLIQDSKDIVEKYKVNQFNTAPTAIRALAKQGIKHVIDKDISSLKVLGTVGEPINEEAWNWYDKNIGKNKCPIVDTWWQTETGGILISSIPGIIDSKPTFATFPFVGIQPVLMDSESNEIIDNDVVGRLCIKFPWPSIARTIWGNHQRYVNTYFSTFNNMYFTGDGAYRDADGNFRITGRVDDVIIVSGHNLGTASIEDVINEHKNVAESAIVGFPHEIKGNALYGFVTLKDSSNVSDNTKDEINKLISDKIGPIAKLDKMQLTEALPKTRSGKIMRRILRKIAENDFDNLGDISTLLNPEAVEAIIKNNIR